MMIEGDAFIEFEMNMVELDRRVLLDVPAVEIGKIRVRALGSVMTDLAGNFLDGDSDGTPGGDFVLELNAGPAVDSGPPAESLLEMVEDQDPLASASPGPEVTLGEDPGLQTAPPGGPSPKP